MERLGDDDYEDVLMWLMLMNMNMMFIELYGDEDGNDNDGDHDDRAFEKEIDVFGLPVSQEALWEESYRIAIWQW